MEQTYETMKELSDELLNYADLEGTELGEYWRLIAELNSYYYCTSPKFYSALEKELKYQLKFAKENFEVVEEEFKHVGKRKVLKFKGE